MIVIGTLDIERIKNMNILKFILGSIIMSMGLFSSAQTYTFTNCSATGKNGPTQAQVNATYAAGNTLSGTVTINSQGVQEWVVPISGSYKIEAYGAEGGRVFTTNVLGGRGVVVSGTVSLTAGTKIYIIAGQKGGTSNLEFSGVGREGGGGGGSFVAFGTTLLSSTPIMVAGGGAGATVPYIGPGAGLDASTSNTGVSGNSGGAGGVSGNGGANGSAGGPYFSSGGGGFYTNGEGGQGGLGGTSFVNGGTGGIGGNNNLGYNNSNDRIDGGFGSGGAARGNSYCGGAGGGGYSGGGGGGSNSPRQGGGGGSFIFSSASDVSSSDGLYNGAGTLNGVITNLNLWNLGAGQVIITSLCAATTAPIIVCLPNITVNNSPGTCDSVVNYTLPIATDNCGSIAVTQTVGLVSGAAFPVGTTTNTYSATNSFGTVFCSFTVTVIDTEVPTIICSADTIVANDVGQCGAVVNYTLPVGVDGCSVATVVLTSGLASGAIFPLGTSTVIYHAVDAVNNTSPPCSFTVTVVDTMAPTIICPADVFSCDTIVNGIEPIATSDNCTGEYVTFTLSGATIGSGMTDASGEVFNVGTTNVMYTVRDSAWNSDTCSFNVVVGASSSTIIMNPFNTDTVCHGSSSLALPAVYPGGGDFSGTGVVGAVFEPSVAGEGVHYVVYTLTEGSSCTTSDSVMIVVDICVGVEENTSLNNVKIYPNPTNGLVYVNLGKHNGMVDYTISTIEGRIVNQEQNVSSNKMTINLRDESKGIYFLRVEDDISSKVYKIVKR